MKELAVINELLNDDSVTEIMINGLSGVYIERAGKLLLSDVCFSDSKAINELAQGILASCGKALNPSKPFADARLADGSRVNIVLPPLSVSGPLITIRKFSKNMLSADDLVNRSACSANMLEFLKFCVSSRQNIVVSGSTGSGKTTLLNLLSSFISEGQRIITIEDTAELQIRQKHTCRLESKTSAENGTGVSIRELVVNALRMRPDRIIVGECRAGEALDMLQAMNTGHDGSMTTAHANSPRDCLKRLEIMTLMAGYDLPVKAVREIISSAVDIIVQTARAKDGSRKIISVSEVTGMEGDTVTLSKIFEFKDEDGVGSFAATGTIPSFLEAQRQKGTAIDMAVFR
ncbi:MAG TPA: type II secretion system protein E [Elusimicrobia bacterium]|nr:MAG: hypothetical protein A2204_07305 [Elusimicrobia bacterium RIFOXYA1_FULL_47_7]OGS10400.1 MAG: hypothetical protein A2386_07085 [Elusimicrobia bacterium RIFOXYB1_FULL_48_9]OGS16704.1 MAG: hypothetical protein A2251_00790 [Elusimicrobia bacterium RIFOXYA2_FULL_47_53]OGS26757.1 MAG: hypothetical protein A2339_04045 [Elusimicrobia bacterium RIFOXYB12_FULL_50_12]OGS31663.1 MAG: hypothetical protein A2323_05620 [Elusimicrobia bacterium RIFOXYB2_FULL_46_23]HBU68751.1 type II secretion system p